ncbi:WbqC family protein [Metabacillus fastidiosus]|uniref:WbqC family protein n=1 Tax=Metabacillus fastidiosus TaxID=1458 RepID=UPI003D266EA5
MIITAHQPSYLPWLGYFHKLALSDVFIHLDQVQFEKNSFINRNKIITSSGPIWLTVPVKHKKHFEKEIKEIEINNELDWKKKHWKSIYYNYKSAPYFHLYSDFFEDAYNREWCYISELNIYLCEKIIDLLGISANIKEMSKEKITGKKNDLILNICSSFDAEIFIFGKQGADYADQSLFKKNRIQTYFQNYNHPKYNQVNNNGFTPYMSIIDLLFNEGPNTLDILMSSNISRDQLNMFKELED